MHLIENIIRNLIANNYGIFMTDSDTPAISRKRVSRGISFTTPSLTKQSFAQECDINHMVACWVNNGSMPRMNTTPAAYPDFSDYMDLKEASDLISEFHDVFDTLPAEVRARFSNDPYVMTDFLGNPDNRDAAIKMGFTFSGDSYQIKKEVPSPAEQPVSKSPDTSKEALKVDSPSPVKSSSEPTQ